MNADEFDEFYAGSAKRLVGQLTVLLGDHAEAQDCVQEAFVRAWTHRHTLDVGGSPEAWVLVTARRLAVSRWRRVTASLRAHARDAAPTVVGEPDLEHVALMSALATLPAAVREAIVLFHLCDLPVQRIAHECGAPVGTIKARLSRGRAALALVLSEEGTTLHA